MLIGLACALNACGDAIVFVSVNFGIVTGPPTCGSNGGQFNLREQSGLVVVVIINSGTHIFTASGQTAQCGDVAPNSQVQVRGHQQRTTVTAQSVQIP
ncbi:MAG TPA: hypothetical protein VMT89_04425 [Candidatus Acidoferrales bacterium]|nr:hypothetical protein [Candidatus Acidoferrales bacterium]